MPALPEAFPARRSIARRRRLRWGAPFNRSRAQIRGQEIAGQTVGRAHADARRAALARRRPRRPRPAPPIPSSRARVQSGGGSGTACRAADAGGAAAGPPDGRASGPARCPTARQRQGCVCRATRLPVDIRKDRCLDRRREHDWRNARRLRDRPQGRRCARGSGAYSSPSRDPTALNTSSAMMSFERSPSSTSHFPSAAWRR